MNQVLKGKTEEYLESRITEIMDMEAGSEEETAAIQNFVAVYALKNKEDEIETNADIKSDQITSDDEFRNKQLNSENGFREKQLEHDDESKANQLKHDRNVAIITVAGTLITAIIGDLIYVKLTHEGWKNEANGYYPSSSTFKNFFGKLPNLIKK